MHDLWMAMVDATKAYPEGACGLILILLVLWACK